MYYQMMPEANPSTRRDAILFWHSTGQYEPSILERIVAYTYLATGGENLWIARIYTSLFWIIGGLALLGGLLVGFAARLARGCTCGQALVGGAELSVGGWAFMVCVFAGGYATAYFVRKQWI